jgi:hypothetical protein
LLVARIVGSSHAVGVVAAQVALDIQLNEALINEGV